MNPRLDRSFFDRPAPVVAPALLGAVMVRELDGVRLSGLVTEVEAYQGREDLACHGRHGKTARNAVMFGKAGYAYVYFTYGMHWLMNVICDGLNIPAAVLIRAIEPLEGLEKMRSLRERDFGKASWLNGPAKLTQAMAITGALDGIDVCAEDSLLWFEQGISPEPDQVQTSPRIGINTTPEPWLSMPWRWKIEQNEALRLARAIIEA